ncbi:hypothetical protein [Nocardioides sp. T2.26MG-1]|uniref:hypothetical protein n=1 Tax=Nocardioides sp. T2.26MG-1 TaxID=3041166 RepID=UPI00247756BC|nr:hypothetical protein [Nocardioides sp. T2.26MG-1]CAI9418006.1 hypothetical protein HIDPHFAB_03162 [Nocardioides sp. T2.26MG-1]
MHEERPIYRLNEEFYSGHAPSTYFRDRLTLLALRAARSDALAAAAGEGILWGQLWIASDDEADADSPEDYEDAAHMRFVATESQVLFHHTVEALLRMMLAHEGWPECPWLRIAAQKDPGTFRDAVAELAKSAWPEERIDRVAQVFMGGVPDEPAPEWIEHRDDAIRLIRILAARLNEQSALYNAAKHGLTMIGGSAALHIVPAAHGSDEPDFDPAAPSARIINERGVVGANGISAVYLEREGKARTGYTWHHVTRWFSPEEAALLTHTALILMDALWTVAKVRYLNHAAPDRMRWINPDVFEALSKIKRGGPVQTWRRQVATETVARSGTDDDRKGSPATN